MTFFYEICVLFFVGIIIRHFRKRLRKIDFSNKTVWITGASSGIGEDLAYLLSKLGASLILSARRENELERVRKNCQHPDKVEIILLDLTKPQEVLKKATNLITEKKIKVDILINNAGISVRSSVLDNAFENEILITNVNYLSQVALTKAILPSLLEKKSGHIVFMNSIQGKVGLANRAGYAATKHALTGFADSLRAEVEEHGVFVTTLHPGYIKTNLAKVALSSQAGSSYGRTDGNIAKGMEASVFAEKALRAIYFRDKEAIIPDRWVNGAIVPLRNLFPNLVFWLIEKKKHMDLKKKDE